MKRLAYTLALLLTCGVGLKAATPEQMEQARVIAIKICLRNLNNGSDYLDNLSPKSLTELEGKLKAKEKENIGALKNIAIPGEGEYASWDKDKFDEYWSKTFVNKTKVENKSFCGTGPKGIKNAISGIKVTKQEANKSDEATKQEAEVQPAKTEEPVKAEEPESTQPQEGNTPVAEPGTEVVTGEETIIEETPLPTEAVTPAPQETPKKEDSNTASIVVLCILVLVVVALVGYALNVMKKNKTRQTDTSVRKTRRSTKESYAAPDYDTISSATVQSDPEEESPFAAYSSYQEPAPAPDPRDREIERLRAEIASLRKSVATTSRPSAATRRADVQTQRRNTPRIIYLAQANADGVFTRADARYNMGNSIFKLVTTDGVSGSFSVIEDATVFELALMMPSDFLVNACTGRNLQLSEGARSIINEASGTAIFEDGRWRVSRKAQIRYSR